MREAATRVAAVARVHRNFYSNATDEISCLEFLSRLCADLSEICGTPIKVEGDAVNVPTTWIQPIGLITNELVTNAAKHGAGKIEVAYRVKGATHEIVVCDQGPGLAKDFDPQKSEGLGMKVVSALARQLRGSLTAQPNPGGRGSCFAVAFSVEGA